MAILEFPPINQADDDGLVALGGDLEMSSLITAYNNAIFPWPISKDYPLAWFSPDPRGVIFCDKVHIGRTLRKVIKKNNYRVTFNCDFEKVIKECSSIKRVGQDSTWITNQIINSYIDLFKEGLAYSVEVWQQESIVAGLYGVCINGNISGESMFSKKANMSKIALISLLQVLNLNKVKYLDTQMLTPITKKMGGIYIPRDHFYKMIKKGFIKKFNQNDFFNVQLNLNLFLENSK